MAATVIPVRGIDYVIKALVYLTGPLMILTGFLVFNRGQWIVLVALAITYVLVWLDDRYPPPQEAPAA